MSASRERGRLGSNELRVMRERWEEGMSERVNISGRKWQEHHTRASTSGEKIM